MAAGRHGRVVASGFADAAAVVTVAPAAGLLLGRRLEGGGSVRGCRFAIWGKRLAGERV